MKSLVFDFGNVVAFFDHKRACRQLADLSSGYVNEDEVFEAVFRSTLERDFDCGYLTAVEFVEELRKLFRLTSSDNDIIAAWSDIFLGNDEVLSLLPRLQTGLIRLVLASNTNELHYRWVTQQFPEHLACFDASVLSFQVGSRKPERQFFQACVAASLVSPEECLFVDDRQDFVEAARSLGMRGMVYVPGRTLLDDLATQGVKVV